MSSEEWKAKYDTLEGRVGKLEQKFEHRDTVVDNMIRRQSVMEEKMNSFEGKLDTITSTTINIAEKLHKAELQRVNDQKEFAKNTDKEVRTTQWSAVSLIVVVIVGLIGACVFTLGRMDEASAKVSNKLDSLTTIYIEVRTKQNIYHPHFRDSTSN